MSRVRAYQLEDGTVVLLKDGNGVEEEIQEIIERERETQNQFEEFLNTELPPPMVFTYEKNLPFSHDGVFKSLKMHIHIDGAEGKINFDETEDLIRVLSSNFYDSVCEIVKIQISKEKKEQEKKQEEESNGS